MNWIVSISGRSVATTAALLLVASCALAQTAPSNLGQSSNGLPAALVNVGFEPPLNGQMPLDLAFRDETGRNVKLGDYFGQKPVLLAFVYYGCPMLCNQVEHGVVSSMKMVSFDPGHDYEVVFVSFDPRETPDMAAQKKADAVSRYGRPSTAAGWHFLTGARDSINAATQAANFRYTFSEKTNLFAHASGIMILTPAGRISRYFYGVEYPTRDVRLGLVEASQGRIGAPIDRVLLFCYQYDPAAATYSASILKIIRLSGVFTVLLIVAGILIFRRRDRASANSNLRPPPGVHTEQGAH
jgi:protein SCO1/2